MRVLKSIVGSVESSYGDEQSRIDGVDEDEIEV